MKFTSEHFPLVVTWILLMSVNSYSAGTREWNGVSSNSICKRSRQIYGTSDICRTQPELIKEVAVGNRMAIAECQKNFYDRKWNCTTKHRNFRKILRSDTREAAYMNAITAAGVLHSVTGACSSGVLWQCHCDRSVKDVASDGLWAWGGCSDDVQFGYNKSKQFTDTKRKRFDIKGLILLHNNEAGRLAITDNMQRVCKCHGLSGSCALKTCWRKMPSFKTIGAELKDRYDGAPKVIGNNDGYTLIPEGDTIKTPGPEDLVYSEESPDFCKSNKKFGTSGTTGRQCNSTSYGPDGCDILCCNRGYTKRTYHVKENCNCKFVWCCEVICDICDTVKTVYTCK